MANEMRLIDANALSEKIGNMKSEITHKRGGYRYCNEAEKNEWDKLDSFDSLVCDTPTVDAVPVVCCKDCKHWHEEIGWCDKHSHFIDDGAACHPWESNEWNMFDADYFCKDGERKDNG